MNLCTNALHAMKDQKGTLTIQLFRKEIGSEEAIETTEVRPGSYVVLSVGDTGYGMDQTTRERIFEPFFTTKCFGEGTGMGLAVIYGIIQDLNGFIAIESTPGQGSTFQVYIPVLQGETKPLQEQILQGAATDTSPLTGNERILVVDDEPLLVDILKLQLEKCGYTVTVTTDSSDALEKFRAQPDQFDLIITDQTMPKLSGDELCWEVLERRPEMRIILCTGHSDIISEKSALAMGIKKFVTKPVSGKDLLATVREVLDGKEG